MSPDAGVTQTTDQGSSSPNEFSVDAGDFDPGVAAEVGVPEADTAEPPAAEPPAAAPAAEPAVDWPSRYGQLEQRLAQLQNRFQPLLDSIEQQRIAAAQRPPVDIDAILARGEKPTIADFMQYVDWKLSQGSQTIASQASWEARVAASEADARGKFTADSMGDQKFAFDQIVGQYIRPHYEQNARLRQAVAEISPDNPAVGEYLLGVMLHVLRSHGDDPLKAARAILYPGQAAQRTTQGIVRAQQSQAQQIVRTTGQGGNRRQLTADDIANMDDAAFERFSAQFDH